MEDYYSLSSFFANIDEAGLIAYFSFAVPTLALAISDEKTDKALEKAQKSTDAKAAELEAVEAAPEAKAAFENGWGRNSRLDWPGREA